MGFFGSGVGGGSGGGTPTASSSTFRRTAVGYSKLTTGYTATDNLGGQTGATYQDTYYIMEDTTDLSFVYGNYAGSNNGTNSITVRAGLLYKSNYYPLYFKGKRDVVIEAGGFAETDPLPSYFKKYDAVSIQTLVTVTAGQSWPTHSNGNLYNPGIADRTTSDIGTATTSLMYSPLCMLGNIRGNSTMKSVALIGSSSITGVGDMPIGFGRRALEGKVAFTKLSHPGDTSGGWVAPFVAAKRYMSHFHDIAICDYGSNEINGGNSVAQIKASLMTLWLDLYSMGIKVCQTTQRHRTTTTDAYATEANQTFTAGFGPGSVCEQINQWILTKPFPLAAAFDLASVVVGPGGKWKAGYTTDGTHATAAGTIAMASLVSVDAAVDPMPSAASSFDAYFIDQTFAKSTAAAAGWKVQRFDVNVSKILIAVGASLGGPTAWELWTVNPVTNLLVAKVGNNSASYSTATLDAEGFRIETLTTPYNLVSGQSYALAFNFATVPQYVTVQAPMLNTAILSIDRQYSTNIPAVGLGFSVGFGYDFKIKLQ